MGRCRRHPHHAVVGICAYCLNDRLLALIEEEEDDELMLTSGGGLYQMSPNSHFACQQSLPSSGLLSAGSCYLPRFAGNVHADSDYINLHTDYRSMPASSNYVISKQHHSLTSSPQFHTSTAPARRAKSSQRIGRPACDIPQGFISEEISRKKRPSIWSILRSLKDDSARVSKKESYAQSYVGDQLHACRGGSHDCRPKTRRAGARMDNFGQDSRWGADDGFTYPGKISFSFTGKESHDSVSKGEYPSSLLSSPNYMASPSRMQGKHHFPSPVSQFTPVTPRQKERCGDEEKGSPKIMQVQTGYGLSMHAESCNHDDESGRGSWISSFFSGRNRRSKSISGSDGIHSHVCSVGASPNAASRGRRKSSSFLNDEMKENANAGPARQSHISRSTKIGIQSPDVHVRSVKHDSHVGLNVSENVYHSSRHSKGSKGNHANGQEGTARSANSPHVLKSESMAVKSPGAKLASFLNMRKNGTMSIDCGRDVRVSPVPLLKVKRDSLNQQEFFDRDEYRLNQGHPRNLEHFNGNTEPVNMPVVDKDALKSPRVMSLQAMKQLLKSPKLAPVKTCNKLEVEDEEYGQQHPISTRSSWSKAFSKTLSPMLGRKHKKKKGIKRQDFVYDGYVHTQQHGHSNRCHMNESVFKQLNSDPGVHHEYPITARKHRYHEHHYGRGTDKGGELLVRETHILPGPDEKGPPQQYSFLSKDYSAFSFYFSPRRSGSSNRVTHAAKTRSVW